MKVDFRGGSSQVDGFGVAGRSIYNAIKRVGHEVDPDAEVSIYFTHPENFGTDAEYNIGYFPWESTEPRPGWRRNMRRMDEIWVTSPVMIDYVKDWGFEAQVFEHGVNSKWTPVTRSTDKKLTFLHQGIEAVRKGGKDTIAAFGAAFAGSKDVQLIMKTPVDTQAIEFGNITSNTKLLPPSDLRKLYNNSHVMIATSYGEGFGLPAFDAMGTGMPVVMTKGVFPHDDTYALPELLVDSHDVKSLWPNIHPGIMKQPDFDHLVDVLRDVKENWLYYSAGAHRQARNIHKEATWDIRTKSAFDDLALRINS